MDDFYEINMKPANDCEVGQQLNKTHKSTASLYSEKQCQYSIFSKQMWILFKEACKLLGDLFLNKHGSLNRDVT